MVELREAGHENAFFGGGGCTLKKSANCTSSLYRLNKTHMNLSRCCFWLILNFKCLCQVGNVFAIGCDKNIRSGEAVRSPTVDALKWSGIKENMDSPLSTDRIEQKSGYAIHHNDNHNSLLIFVVTDVIQV